MATEEITTVSEPKKTLSVDLEKFDAATLRLSCASSMMTALAIYQRTCDDDAPSNQVLSDAMYGIGLMLNDAWNTLIDSGSCQRAAGRA